MYVEYTELWTFLEKFCTLNIQNCVYSLKKSCTFIEKLWTLNIFNILYYFKNCIPKIYKIVKILVDTVFCSILIHASKSKDQKKKKEKKKKEKKMWKIMNFKAKKAKNKYNMFEWWIKKSQHLKKPIFTEILTKTLTR